MKDLKLYVGIGCALLLVYFIFTISQPTPTDWSPTLIDNQKAPFGTKVLFERINDILPNAKVQAYRSPAYTVLTANRQAKNVCYLVVCNRLYLTKVDIAALNQFLAAGNTVFIAAQYWGGKLTDDLNVDFDYQPRADQTLLQFTNPKLDSARTYYIDHDCTAYQFATFDTTRATVIGQNSAHYANLLRYQIGKGQLFLFANPLMLSNYSILQPQGQAYAATALSYIPKNTRTLLWDEYYTQGNGQEQSPMRVFLKNPSLRWAYFIALYGLLFFVLFEIKRRQRIIPVVTPPANTSVAFVTHVGQVYYEERNHNDILEKKVTYLLAYIRQRYGLKTNPIDAEFITLLSNKSGASPELLNQLFHSIAQLKGHTITDAQLIEINQYIEKFYNQTR